MAERRSSRTIGHDDHYDDELAESADDELADRDAGLTAAQAAQAALAAAPTTCGPTRLAPRSATEAAGHVGDPPTRIARSPAQHVEGCHGVQTTGPHQVPDRALDDDPVVQGVLQLAGDDAVLLGRERRGENLRDGAAVGRSGR